MTQTKDLDQYLIDITPIPPEWTPGSESIPAYFVGSTAPNNVEDGWQLVPDPAPVIDKIAKFLGEQPEPELLIAVHGYNTALGAFASEDNPLKLGDGVRGWYQNIRNHMEAQYQGTSKNLMFIGYRWPSEVVKGLGNDSFGHKLEYAQESLPVALKVILILSIFLLAGLSTIAVTTDLPGSASFAIAGVSLIILATIAMSIVFSLFLLRISGYFRDAYRATNFGVPDLVEFIRKLDKAVLESNPSRGWSHRGIKLSFIGHSMGGFVVTNTVRILSDIFDDKATGSANVGSNKAKAPSPRIGNVFSLGRLVLVSPDIPAETIISGRANFLSSSLRRFEETYLFSNEGDMALKLASTAANYFSYSSRTREGGYRLGNVVVRAPRPSEQLPSDNVLSQYGIINYDAERKCLRDVQSQGDDQIVEPIKEKVTDGEDTYEVSSFLQNLYTLDSTSLGMRQGRIAGESERPIAELFTVFDCTDYFEVDPSNGNSSGKKFGILSRALGKPSLKFWDYVFLCFDYFTGQIDTHGGYFYSAPQDPSDASKQRNHPDAQFSKHLIYGLACLGFQTLLLKHGKTTANTSLDERKSALQALSTECEKHGVQVLLAPERYNRDILGLKSDRDGYY
ncbi:MAG: alpha/beta hydrolase [Kovacikia sp.]